MYSNLSISGTREKDLNLLLSNTFKELLYEANSDSWETIGEKNGVVMSRKIINGSPINCTRGTGIVHASPDEVFKVTHDVKKVMQWKKIMVEGEVIKHLDDATNLLYLAFKGKFPVSPRDFCILSSYRMESDGTYLQILRSIHHEEVPIISGYVRAKLLTSGFIIKPIKTEQGRKSNIATSSEVTYILQFDPKGWLPSFVANKLGEYFPLSIARIRSLFGRTSFDSHSSEEEERLVTTRNSLPLRTSSLLSPPKRQIIIESDDDEEYKDTTSDLTSLNVENVDQFNQCLSVVQKEMSQLQEVATKYQQRIRELERWLTAHEQSMRVKINEYHNESEKKTRALELDSNQKFLHLQEQQRQLDLFSRSRDETWITKHTQLSNKVSRVESTLLKWQQPLSTWKGRVLLFIFLITWPWMSYKILDITRVWWRNFHKSRLLSIFLSIGGWFVFATRFIRNAQLDKKVAGLTRK